MSSYHTYSILALTLAMTAARPSQVPVSPSGSVVFEVTSIPYRYVAGKNLGEPVEFAVHVLGGDLKRSVDYERKMTPFIVTVKGREAYAMFRQISGRDILNVEVRPTRSRGCQVTSSMSLLIVKGDSCGGTFMDPRIDSVTGRPRTH